MHDVLIMLTKNAHRQQNNRLIHHTTTVLSVCKRGISLVPGSWQRGRLVVGQRLIVEGRSGSSSGSRCETESDSRAGDPHLLGTVLDFHDDDCVLLLLSLSLLGCLVIEEDDDAVCV